MVFKPNYNFQKAERQKAKQARKEQKAREKEGRKAEPVTGVAADAPLADAAPPAEDRPGVPQ